MSNERGAREYGLVRGYVESRELKIHHDWDVRGSYAGERER